MRWRWSKTMNMTHLNIFLAVLLTIGFTNTAEGSRRAQRKKDSNDGLYIPAPSAESIQALAEAMGAAGFESYTEGKALVKRLIPADSQPDLDVVEHQGVIGKAGVDFPALPNIPNTGFNCKNVPTGYYADLETDCQVFHICDTSRKISFLCPNGTIFSQSHLICDWWFKVDCASSPALYESSVEYYSNEQKKSQKVTKILSKNADLQQISDSNIRAESRRASVNVPSTTERLLKHRQRLFNEASNVPTTKPSSRSYQALFNINPTQRAQAAATFENKRKNLVQLIANNFGNAPVKSTPPTYYEVSTRRSNIPAGDYNSIREMQEAAETASFAQNQNRQFLRDHNNKNLRPFAVYNPNLPPQSIKTKNNPSSLTTLYDIKSQHGSQYTQEATTKRHTLIPYTKSYVSSLNEKREPYTRPGVSLLKNFLEKEKNRTVFATTEKLLQATARNGDLNNNNLLNTASEGNLDKFESSTKIPHTVRDDRITASTGRFETYSTILDALSTTERSYQERKQRVLNNINSDFSSPTEPTLLTTVPEKYYGNEPNRPGLIVPPSLTPKTLHSLAIYYATAMDNLSTEKPHDENEVTIPAIDDFETMEDDLPNIFSRQTINKYSSLFSHGTPNDELLEEIKLDPNGTYNEIMEDLALQMSQMPLATSPQIRELAQVFTHALSAYLQDPVQFRKVLSDIRPTPPSFGEMFTATDYSTNTESTTTVNEDDDEILGFSDDHKTRDLNNSLRDAKALKVATDYTFEATTTIKPTTTPIYTTTYVPTPRSPFRCCGRISASYTTASTPIMPYYFTTSRSPKSYQAPTTDSYTSSHYGGFQNNSHNDSEKPYGHGLKPTGVKTISDYSEITNLPSAWDDDVTDSTLQPITNSHQMFESKKIRTTTTFPEPLPTHFSDADSIELENEEELQRAHSQSFVSPQSNSIRQGKQLVQDKNSVKKPSIDLEAPTLPDIETTTLQATTQSYTTTVKDQTEAYTTTTPVSSSIFTSPDTEKTTYEFQWPTSFDNWQSTIIDPITLNDGLSLSAHDQSSLKLTQQTKNIVSTTATPTTTYYYTTTEQAPSSTINYEVTTNHFGNHREGKALREPTSTEISQDLTTIADTVVEKAKEIMGGMNSTTTQKLMNVMKKTKSKTVKRLILLLVQTCDDDHNSTAEASKKALLEALMAVSQKDMEDIAKEEATETTAPGIDIQTTQFKRRMDRIPIESRSDKSLNINPKAVNSLSNPTTTETLTQSETTTANVITTTIPTRRGARKFQTRTTQETSTTLADRPFAEARVAQDKTQSDTRAIELLRSLYTIAAKWG